MKRFLLAIAVCCSALANAQSPPPQTTRDAVAEVRNNDPGRAAKPNNTESAQGRVSAHDTYRIQHSTPVETNNADAEPKKTANDHRHPKQESEDRWGVAEWAAIGSAAGSVVSALIAIALAFLGFYSWRTSKAAVDIAKDSLDASKQLAINQSRPYLFITTTKLVYGSLFDESNNEVSVTLKNYGQTPAQLTSFSAKIIEGIDQRETVVEEKLIRNALGHGETVDMQVVFRAPNAAQILAGKVSLKLLISAQYRGMDGALRHTREPFVFYSDGRNYGFIPCDGDEHRSRD